MHAVFSVTQAGPGCSSAVEHPWVSPFPPGLRPHLLVPVPEYTVVNEGCPGAEWNIMCRECCEYDQIECVCPGRKEVVGYTIPCCRNEENECDSCLIHPGECGTGPLVDSMFSEVVDGSRRDT